MAEMPLVIVDVNAAGLRRNADEHRAVRSDIAVNGGHGDAPRVVIAPRTSKIVFTPRLKPSTIARKYSVPVIILTDQGIATRIERSPSRTLKSLPRTFHEPDARRDALISKDNYGNTVFSRDIDGFNRGVKTIFDVRGAMTTRGRRRGRR